MNIRGLELNVQIVGEGTPFIWGHGLMSSIEGEDELDWFQWSSFPKNLKLVRYDARGHGRSQPSYRPEDYHWFNLGQDMVAVADAIGAGKFIAGGDSMGCATAIYAALQAPDRIGALVLVIPPTAWETRAAQGQLYKRFALIGGLLGGGMLARLMSGNMERMLPAWMVQAEPEKLRGMAQGLRALRARTLWNLMRGAATTNLPPRQDFKSLADIPAMILAWVGDPTHPVASAEELHKLLPRSSLFVAQGYEEFKMIPRRLREFVLQFA
jgi:3-oxoadipate enol-lactonase